ncbi:DUF7557 family protein [Methanobacterium paludis]|uniref:Uncharacterized protein n=1 Tax=Methanobacterium paludis (strain DSM 25820 / JCM 18151 / SWAN1) TaxID=868131 RepID=F6D2S0_METPW|nr:hypothetical protein [Methanobacterium paludis]AEG18649.1 hypothetical protein MSWAN_1638 [Methanobacterium paludis]
MVKTIKISNETHEELSKIGSKGETYEDIIKRLLNSYLDEYEIEMLTTSLELNLRESWNKWTNESQKTAKDILTKLENTGFYEIPKGIKQIMGD